MDEMQKVPDVIYLPWQDAMWCVKRIYDTDIEYVPKAYLDAAEQRAAEGEGNIRTLLEEMRNISTDKDGYQLCPWCTGRLNRKRTHQKNCPHQAVVKWLEEHSPHEHG